MKKQPKTWRQFYKTRIAPYFDALEKRFGFVVELPREQTVEVHFHFRHPQSQVDVDLVLPQASVPYVFISVPDARAPRRMKRIALFDLIRKRCPEKQVRVPKGIIGPELDLDHYLQRYSEVLLEHCEDYLIPLPKSEKGRS